MEPAKEGSSPARRSVSPFATLGILASGLMLIAATSRKRRDKVSLQSNSEQIFNRPRPQNGSAEETQVPAGNAPVGSDIEPSPENQQETHKCRPDQTPMAKWILEGAAVLLGIFVAWIYNGQLGVMNSQLRTMKDQMKDTVESRRAWLGASPTFNLAMNPVFSVMEQNGKKRVLVAMELTGWIRNSGVTPALSEHDFFWIVWNKTAPIVLGNQCSQNFHFWESDLNIPRGQAVFPGEEKPVKTVPMTTALLGESERDLAGISLIGCIYYRDMQRVEHHTEVVYYMRYKEKVFPKQLYAGIDVLYTPIDAFQMVEAKAD
jgi:hypothetical protein